MVPHLRRDGTLGAIRQTTIAAIERKIPLERRIGRYRLRFDQFTSRRMGAVHPAGTGAEVAVRAIVWRMGLRFRTNNGDLPGSPDLANRWRKWAIFVHGCFWHWHAGCRKATIPKRNRPYWLKKFATNRARDLRVARGLRRLGYAVLKVWQCQLSPERIGRLDTQLRARLFVPAGRKR